MSLAHTFLTGVERFTKDLDIEKMRADVKSFVERHPNLTTRERAGVLVDLTARKAAALGAVASLPPGFLALATLGPELGTIILMQSRLILGLHILYHQEPEPEERALEIVAGLAAGAGMHVGRRLSVQAVETVAKRLLLGAFGKRAGRVVPLAGAAVGALVNYVTVRAVGRAAIARIEKLYGPPEIGGTGRVVDVSGRKA